MRTEPTTVASTVHLYRDFRFEVALKLLSFWRFCLDVIDIKWKYLPHAAAISASDAYQLTSYAQAYLAGQIWLVYPVLGSDRQPVALKQQTHYGSNDSSSDDIKNNESIDAHLWLMPFDVLTGTLNGEVLPHLDKA